jgi:hypothetical protein
VLFPYFYVHFNLTLLVAVAIIFVVIDVVEVGIVPVDGILL